MQHFEMHIALSTPSQRGNTDGHQNKVVFRVWGLARAVREGGEVAGMIQSAKVVEIIYYPHIWWIHRELSVTLT